MGVVDEKHNPQTEVNTGQIKFSVRDTSFLVSAISRTQLSGAEINQAYSTMSKLEKFHNFLLERNNIIKGV
jgi:hypothetical protein